MSDNVISYIEMCRRERTSLQQGMNFGLGGNHSVIDFGRNLDLEIAVRGGGHSVAGKALANGGLVIDLRRMNAVSVEPKARTAVVAGGATMSHLDRATEVHGLATTGGRVSTTGVGGFTLVGGGGWLDRKFGIGRGRWRRHLPNRA